jgi:hypothetical protein
MRDERIVLESRKVRGQRETLICGCAPPHYRFVTGCSSNDHCAIMIADLVVFELNVCQRGHAASARIEYTRCLVSCMGEEMAVEVSVRLISSKLLESKRS